MKTKTMKPISFKVSKSDRLIIRKIANRAVSMAKKHGIEYHVQDCDMDLTACHANGCPLHLARLLAFPDFDFAHDVFGIARHINRETGKLERFFVPRCAI